jgi:hypothetical protein
METEWKHRRPQKSYRRAVRKKQVFKQLCIWYENGYATEATAYRLARALDMHPSNHFHNILNEMVDEGILKRELRPQPGRVDTYFYSLADASLLITSKLTRRVIVKRRGVVSGQLELAL